MPDDTTPTTVVPTGHTGVPDVETFATAVAEKAARENPGVTFHPGTVVAVAADTNTQYVTCTVLVDGDSPSNTTQAVSLIGVVAAGQRCMVLFVPPHGVYVLGYFGPAPGGANTPFDDVFVESGISTTGTLSKSKDVTFTVAESATAQIQVVAHSLPPLNGGGDILSAFFTVTSGPSTPSSSTPGTSSDATTTFTGTLPPGDYAITFGAAGTCGASLFTFSVALSVTYP